LGKNPVIKAHIHKGFQRAFLTEGSAIVKGNGRLCSFKAGDAAGHDIYRRNQRPHIKRIEN
jgi:hypothetical protein